MEMSQLRTFRAVAETLNFTRAAERLHLTQSAVSHQIKALEEELGEPLFIRAKRGVKLSQAGKIALEYVERILDETEALRERIAGKENSPAGRVRVAAATQAFVHLFAPLFESFMDSHPGVDLAFRTTVSTEQTVADILNGAADVGFASLAVYSPNLQVTKLFEDELLLIIGSEHPLARKRALTVADLSQLRFILYEQKTVMRKLVDDFFASLGVTPRITMLMENIEAIKSLVGAGLGASVLPVPAIGKEAADRKVTLMRVENQILSRQLGLVTLRSNYVPPPVREMISMVRQEITRPVAHKTATQ